MGHIFTVWNHTEKKHDFLEEKNKILDSITILFDLCVSEPQNDHVGLLVLKCLLPSFSVTSSSKRVPG